MQALKEILLRGFESKDLDYKAPSQWDEKDKKACCEIVKDILAMANTLGGYIVIGVKERGNGFEWKGLTTEQIRSFETSRINRFVQNYADPPINTLLKKVDHSGKTFAIIEIPRFSNTPHICQKDYPSVLISPALYVRTDTNESAPVKSSSDFRMAALCHDIGHLPFSHVAEKDLLPEGWNHERLTREFILSEEMEEIWESITPPLRSLDVVKLAIGPKKAPDLKYSDWEAVLAEIIVGDAFGVDRVKQRGHILNNKYSLNEKQSSYLERNKRLYD